MLMLRLFHLLFIYNFTSIAIVNVLIVGLVLLYPSE